MKRIHPYPTLLGDVELEVHRVRLDDIAAQFSMISPERRVVALREAGREGWRTATLEVRVRTLARELQEGDWTEVGCAVLLYDRRTRVRDHFLLERSEGGTWVGEVILHADRHAGRSDLTAEVVATVGGVEGRTIGTSGSSWTVDPEASVPKKKEVVRTEWTDLGGEEHPHLWAYRNDPWLIEPHGEQPVVRLNRRFEGLYGVLSGGRAADRSAREMIATEIARDTWTVLFDAALRAVERDEQGNTTWPGGWQETVLRTMLPHVLPEHSAEDAVAEFSDVDDPGAGTGPQVVHAAATLARRNANLGRFVRTLNKKAQEE